MLKGMESSAATISWAVTSAQQEDIATIFQKTAQFAVCLEYSTSEFLSKATKSFAINLSWPRFHPIF